MTQPLLFDVDDGVGRITLNRPAAMNSYDVALIEALGGVLDQVEARDDVGALVLTGAGTVFSGGADVRLILDAVESSALREDADRLVRTLHAALLRLHGVGVPTVCAVNGACAGGAVGMALSCDITWAAQSASFTAAFSAIALTPDTGASYLLPRAVGERVARELFLTNRRVKADEALALGLVSRVLPDEVLLEKATELARRLAAGPTSALVQTRELVDRSARHDLAAHLDAERESVIRCMETENHAEGVRAFLAKRRPAFSRS